MRTFTDIRYVSLIAEVFCSLNEDQMGYTVKMRCSGAVSQQKHMLKQIYRTC